MRHVVREEHLTWIVQLHDLSCSSVNARGRSLCTQPIT